MFKSNENKRCFVAIVAIVVCLAFVGVARADWQELTKLTASDGAVNDNFGSVSISGDYAIVGTYRNESAYIFKRDGASWTEQAILSGYTDQNFGISVSISGDYAIVGASRDNSYQGAAYIFYRDQRWAEQLGSAGQTDRLRWCSWGTFWWFCFYRQ